MWIPIAFALIIAVGLAVLWPYLRPRSLTTDIVDIDPRLAELYSQRDTLYKAARDARFDLDMGKLSVDDYEQQSAKIKQQAASVLRSLDQVEQSLLSPEVNARIEAEVAAHRQAGKRAPAQGDDAALEAAIAAARRTRSSAANGKTDRFCGKCGAPIHAQDRFCGRCGQIARSD